MPAKIVTEEVEKEVTMMTQPEAHFVSLVKHAANRMPFRVIKSQKGGESNSMSFVVQSILVPKEMAGPKGSELEKLVGVKGNEWLAEANVAKAEQHEDYVKLVQVPAAKMDAESVQMVKLPGGAIALVGKTAAGVDASKMLTVNKSQIPQSTTREPMSVEGDAPYVEPAYVSLGPTFGDLLYDETDHMMDIIFGTLRQSASDLPTMKKTILGAVDSFRQFLVIALDQLAPVAAKAAAKKFEPLIEALKACAGKCSGPEEKEKEADVMALFETKEEFMAAIGSVVDAKLEAWEAKKAKVPPEDVGTDAAKKAKPADGTDGTDGTDGKKAKAPGDPVIQDDDVAPTNSMFNKSVKSLAESLSKLEGLLGGLSAKVESIAAKQETMGQELGVLPGAAEDVPDDKKPAAKSEEKSSVFAGILSGKALDRRGVRAQFGR